MMSTGCHLFVFVFFLLVAELDGLVKNSTTTSEEKLPTTLEDWATTLRFGLL